MKPGFTNKGIEVSMKKTFFCGALIGLAICATASAQTSKRGIAAEAAKSLADSVSANAQRDIDAQREVEIARQIANIRVEAAIARQNAAAQSDARRSSAPGAAAQGQQQRDAEMAKLDQAHPQWRQITNSLIFKSWLETVPVSQKRLCLDSWSSDVATACIDLFFSTQLLAPRGSAAPQ